MKVHPKGKEEPDDVRRYKSPSTGEYVQAHQYIAEIMVSRKAAKQGKDLPYKYWNGSDEWAKEFKSQVASAAQLLNKYSSSVIIKAVLNVKWAYSLRTAKLISEIENQQKIAEVNESKIDQIDVVVDPQVIGKTEKRVSFLGRLRATQN
jgi:hypothetical protein